MLMEGEDFPSRKTQEINSELRFLTSGEHVAYSERFNSLRFGPVREFMSDHFGRSNCFYCIVCVPLPHNFLLFLKSTVIGSRNRKVSAHHLLFSFFSGFLLVSFELSLVPTKLRDE